VWRWAGAGLAAERIEQPKGEGDWKNGREVDDVRLVW